MKLIFIIHYPHHRKISETEKRTKRKQVELSKIEIYVAYIRHFFRQDNLPGYRAI